MKLLQQTYLEMALLSGYILFTILLNVVAYLISMFYRKKFDQPSPRAGFIIATIMALLFLITIYMGRGGMYMLEVVSVLALLASGAASAYSITSLFFTMRKVRK